MSITVTVLGSADAGAAGGNFYSCYFIKTEKHGILIDAGPTVMPALIKHGFSSDDVDLLLITHFHGDHIGGIPLLLLEAAIKYQRKNKLVIYCPVGGKNIIRKLCDLMYAGSDLTEKVPLEFHEFEGEQKLKTAFGRLLTFKAVHSKRANPHSLRLEIGEKILAFTGDTGWNENIPLLCENSDVFFCECSSLSKKIKTHLNLHQITDRLTQLKSKKIILTHLGDEMLKVKVKPTLVKAYLGLTINL